MPKTEETPATDFLLDEPAVAKDPGPFFDELRSSRPVARTDAHGGFWTCRATPTCARQRCTPRSYPAPAA